MFMKTGKCWFSIGTLKVVFNINWFRISYELFKNCTYLSCVTCHAKELC